MRNVKNMESRLVGSSSEKLASRSNSKGVDGSMIYPTAKLCYPSTIRRCEDSD